MFISGQILQNTPNVERMNDTQILTNCSDRPNTAQSYVEANTPN
jgi:hypothetical protein